jgi:succinyl-diaminopimelate desuccinylase
MDEVALAERLIAFDTSAGDGLRRAAEFVGGWLESRDISVTQIDARGLPVTMAEVGPPDAPTLVMHGHLDVVPGNAEQFRPRVAGDRLVGRGAFDMKGALAVMLLILHDARTQERVRLRLGIVSDEESEEEADRGSDALVDGDPDRGQRAIRARLDPVARRQCDRQGGRGVPRPRVATVCAAEFRALRSSLDQSRAYLGRGRPQSSSGHLRYRR